MTPPPMRSKTMMKKLLKDRFLRTIPLTAVALMALAALLSGCGSTDPTASNGDPDDAAHQQAKSEVQQNVQKALNDPSVSAEEKAKIQAAAAMGQTAISANAGKAPQHDKK